MSVYVLSEQTGLDGYWITDILAGIKSEADKKNLRIEVFPMTEMTVSFPERPVVLVVGYSKNWFSYVCRRIAGFGAQPLLVNARADLLPETAVGGVCFDYDGGMKTLVSYLLRCGKKNIAFVGSDGGRVSYDYKKRAFLSACNEENAENCFLFGGRDTAEAASAFLKASGGYDAVICSRDVEAKLIMREMSHRHIALPESLYVASFGGGKLAEETSPSLTAVHTPFARLGSEAVKLYQFLRQNRETECASVSVKCRLDVRDSTAGIKALTLPADTVDRHPAYINDNEYMTFLQAEALVRGWDTLDRNIVRCMTEGNNTSAIADKLFISQSSVKYRIKKMLTSADIKNRNELLSVVSKFGLL